MNGSASVDSVPCEVGNDPVIYKLKVGNRRDEKRINCLVNSGATRRTGKMGEQTAQACANDFIIADLF